MESCRRHYFSIKKIVSSLQRKVVDINSYDPCVSNCQIQGTQMTVVWHEEDMKVSHANPAIVTDLIKWVQGCFDGDNIGKLRITRGKKHEFFGMSFNFTKKGEVKITMDDFVTNIVSTFPCKTGQIRDTPASDVLFKVRDISPPLNEERSKLFHRYTAQLLYLSKRV